MSKYIRAILCALRGHPVSLLCGYSDAKGYCPIEKCRCGKIYISYPACNGWHKERQEYDFPIEELVIE